MTELRWIVKGAERQLQYRSLIPTYQASGAWGEPSVWSDWADVKVVFSDPDEEP